MRQGAVRRSQIGKMLAKGLELTQRKGQLGVLVGETVNVLCSLLKVFHRISRFGCDRFDDFHHLCRGFAQIGCPFAGEHFAIFRAA